jgi:hypothetical protein
MTIPFRLRFRRFACLAMLIVGVPAFAQSPDAEKPAERVRPEVATHLSPVQQLLRDKMPREALVKLTAAEAVGNLTDYETFIIHRLRGPAAAQAGDEPLALKSFVAVVDSPRLTVMERLQVLENITGLAFKAKDYAKAAAAAGRYVNDGGKSMNVLLIRSNSLFLTKDYAAAAASVEAEFSALPANTTPGEDRLRLLANCYLQQDDSGKLNAVMERLVMHYPKPDYWNEVIRAVQRKPGFANRLSLDLGRLLRSTGALRRAEDYTAFADQALRAGFPAEARLLLEEGFSKAVLGTGAEAAMHGKLRDQANRAAAEDARNLATNEMAARAARDGTGLVSLGYTVVVAGQYDKGIGLMEEGIRKGGLRQPEDAKLMLAAAHMLGGKSALVAPAVADVRGSDGAADLARLWALHARSKV